MFARVGDVRLFFDIEGSKLEADGPAMREKPTLLVLHGGPGLDHTFYRPVFSDLSRVAQVVYLDQRGHGRSDRSDPSRWTLAQWADDVHGFCEALGIDRPVVLGTSFGGYVAMAYAIRNPGHPGKLILVSTALRGTDDPERRGRVLEAFERRGGSAAREAAARALDERSPRAFAEYLRVCGPAYNRTAADPDALKRRILNQEMIPFFERRGGEGATFNFREELANVRCPTLVVGGDDDPITPVAEQQEIVRALPAGLGRLERFAGCGHGVCRDDPAGMVRAVAAFLRD
jgi:pimeloyl-ACP methyl ester carboxylesterase